jgi:hypothetical protein
MWGCGLILNGIRRSGESCEKSNQLLVSVKGGEFPDDVKDY